MDIQNNNYPNVPSYKIANMRSMERIIEKGTDEQRRLDKRYTSVLFVVITFLVITNIGLIGAVMYLISQNTSLQTKAVNQTSYTSTTPLSSSPSDFTIHGSQPASQQTSYVPIVGNAEQLTAMTEQLKQNANNADQQNVYTQALGQAVDIKKKSEISAIGSIMNIYVMEHDGLPDNFPDSPRCIGKNSSCFDLYTLLVPEYLDHPYVDPSGTEANTGYSIGISHDGITSVIVQAVGTDGKIIEVRK